MIAIVYPRVSTEEQAREGYSLAAQREACYGRAISLGYRPEEIIEISDDVSGDILERPGLVRVRELVRRGGVGHFVCLDPDRFSRKLTYQLIVTEEMDRAGVKLEFINFEWKNTAEGRLYYSMRGAFAEYEKEKIKERSMRGKRQKAKEGKLTHNPRNYGYSFDKETDTFIINEAEASWVRQMYEWCAKEQIGSYAISTRLNDMGIPSPRGKDWQKTTALRILRNPTYRGELILQRHDTQGMKGNRYRPIADRVQRKLRPESEWCRVIVPGIVERELWDRAQVVLDMCRRQRPGLSVTDYLLSGLCTCGVCGNTIHGYLSTSKGVKRPYYVCTGRSPGTRGHDKCALPFLPAPNLEAFVWQQAEEWVRNPQKLRAVLARQSAGTVGHSAELERVDRQLDELSQEQSRLLTLYQKGIAVQEVEARLEDIASRESKLRLARASLAAVPTPRPLPSIVELEKVMADLLHYLESESFADRRIVVKRLVNRVIISPGHFHIIANI